MWKDGLIRDLLCTFVESMLHCHIWISYVCQHFFFKQENFNKQTIFVLFKHSNQHHHCQAKQSTSSFFKQSNQHHHFSSKAINIIIFKQSNQHHHFLSKAINIIIVQAKEAVSSFFKLHHQFLVNIITIICWHFIYYKRDIRVRKHNHPI